VAGRAERTRRIASGNPARNNTPRASHDVRPAKAPVRRGRKDGASRQKKTELKFRRAKPRGVANGNQDKSRKTGPLSRPFGCAAAGWNLLSAKSNVPRCENSAGIKALFSGGAVYDCAVFNRVDERTSGSDVTLRKRPTFAKKWCCWLRGGGRMILRSAEGRTGPGGTQLVFRVQLMKKKRKIEKKKK